MRKRWFAAVVAVGSLSLSGVTVAEAAAPSRTVASAVVVPGDSVDAVASNPLPSLAAPADPADEVKGLPNDLAGLPADGSDVVDPGTAWTPVEGLPVTVREDATPSPSPSASPGAMPGAGLAGAVRVVPAVAHTVVDETAPVEVSVTTPQDASDAAMVIELSPADAVAAPSDGPSDSAGPSPSASPSESPSASGSASPSAPGSGSANWPSRRPLRSA